MNGFMVRYLSDGTGLPQITAVTVAKSASVWRQSRVSSPKSSNKTRHPLLMDPTAESQPSAASRNHSGLETTAHGDNCKEIQEEEKKCVDNGTFYRDVGVCVTHVAIWRHEATRQVAFGDVKRKDSFIVWTRRCVPSLRRGKLTHS